MNVDILTDLRNQAGAVRDTAPFQPLTARVVAQCLSGVIRMVALEHGATRMHQACAAIAACDRAWDTSLRDLPFGSGAAELTLACAVRGFFPVATVTALRAALAYWATEFDPSEWQRLAA